MRVTDALYLYARLLTRHTLTAALAKSQNGNQVINCTANIKLVGCLRYTRPIYLRSHCRSASIAVENWVGEGGTWKVLKAFAILSFMNEDHKMNFMLTQILQFAHSHTFTRAVKGFLFPYHIYNTYAYQWKISKCWQRHAKHTHTQTHRHIRMNIIIKLMWHTCFQMDVIFPNIHGSPSRRREQQQQLRAITG